MNDFFDIPPLKPCGKCGELRSVYEFNLNSKSPDGLDYICRECRQFVNRCNIIKGADKRRAYFEEHKQEQYERYHQYYKENRKYIQLYARVKRLQEKIAKEERRKAEIESMKKWTKKGGEKTW